MNTRKTKNSIEYGINQLIIAILLTAAWNRDCGYVTCEAIVDWGKDLEMYGSQA